MTPTNAFENQLQDAMSELRRTLVELFEGAGIDALRSYPASRKLGINKNLTWKASKIIRATDPAETLRHLPGTGGVHILLDAFRAYGAPAELVAACEAAFGRMDATIAEHSGDRETLELMIDSIEPDGDDREPLEASRRLAFRGNSGIWGIQAKARVTTFILTPAKDDPDLIDTYMVAGFLNLRRLRSETPWTLLKLHGYQDDGTTRAGDAMIPLDPEGGAASGLPLLKRFSSSHLPELVSRDEGNDTRIIELPAAQIGNRGALDLFFGTYTPSFATPYRDLEDDRGEFQTDINIPVEQLQFDVLIHQDLPRLEPLRFELFGRLEGSVLPPRLRDQRKALPIPTRIQAMGAGTDALDNPLIPAYRRMMEACIHGAGIDPEALVAHRVLIDYPPVPSTAIFSFPLASR